MYRLFILLSVCFVFLCTKCKKPDNKQFNLHYLYQSWNNEHEKNSDSTLQYRPDSMSLGPSRGRKKLIFKPNNVCEYYTIAPSCGLELNEGKWIAQKNNIYELQFPRKPTKNIKFEIISLEKNLLIIKIIK